MLNPFVYFGGAEGDRTPDPKTASRERQKTTILELFAWFPVYYAESTGLRHYNDYYLLR